MGGLPTRSDETLIDSTGFFGVEFLGRAWCAWGDHRYQRACILIRGQASNGPNGSPGFPCAGEGRSSISSHLSQTSAGKRDYFIAFFLYAPQRTADRCSKTPSKLNSSVVVSTSGRRRALHAKAGAGRREHLEPREPKIRRFNAEQTEGSLFWSEVRLKGAWFEIRVITTTRVLPDLFVLYFSRAVLELDEDGSGKPLSFSKEDSIPAERAVSARSDSLP
jgi:hypothetical protein